MNPLTNIRNVNKMNQRELELGIAGTKTSWHMDYKDSAWIFIGGLPYDLSEGDILCVFSQYGEIVNINLVRDQKTGKSKGFCFICYEDQRSTILAVDNLNGIEVLGRTVRVDHVKNYKPPKETGDEDEITQKIRSEGVAPTAPATSDESSEEETVPKKKLKKDKKKKKKKSKRKSSSSDSASSGDSPTPKMRIKQERPDSGVRVKQERDTARDSRVSSYPERDRDRDSRDARGTVIKRERDPSPSRSREDRTHPSGNHRFKDSGRDRYDDRRRDRDTTSREGQSSNTRDRDRYDKDYSRHDRERSDGRDRYDDRSRGRGGRR